MRYCAYKYKNIFKLYYLMLCIVVSTHAQGYQNSSIVPKSGCINKWEESIRFDEDIIEVRKKFIDTLSKWKRLRLISTNYNNIDSIQIDDNVCMNTKKNYCVLFIKRIPHNKSFKIVGIDFVLGVLEKNNWNFYYANLPGFSYQKSYLKKKYKTRIINFNILANALREIITVNYFKTDCMINNQFVEGMDNSNVRVAHQLFLTKSGPYQTDEK